MNIEERIEELLSKMTLHEKVGQLHQVAPSKVGGFEIPEEEAFKLYKSGDMDEKTYDAIINHKMLSNHEDEIRKGEIGSFISVMDAETANHYQKIAVEESRLGIPLIFGLDVIHGFKTMFPIPLAESCSFDDELFEELEELLVMGDVGVPTAEKICEELKKKVKKEGIKNPNEIHRLLEETVSDMLRGGEELDLSTTPSIILVIGVNGVGKTTTIGKLANHLTKQGKKVILAAGDTFRAAAIEQLEIWADRSHCEIIKQNEGSDPAAVIYDAISAAKARHADVIICDTAGRLHNKKPLMDELAKINRIIDRELPDASKEKLLVLDATTGQNAVNQAEQFSLATGITGIVLTKLDGTAKGGVVLAIKEGLGIPVKYIGVGEQIDDLQPFDAEDFARALFAQN